MQDYRQELILAPAGSCPLPVPSFADIALPVPRLSAVSTWGVHDLNSRIMDDLNLMPAVWVRLLRVASGLVERRAELDDRDSRSRPRRAGAALCPSDRAKAHHDGAADRDQHHPDRHNETKGTDTRPTVKPSTLKLPQVQVLPSADPR